MPLSRNVQLVSQCWCFWSQAYLVALVARARSCLKQGLTALFIVKAEPSAQDGRRQASAFHDVSSMFYRILTSPRGCLQYVRDSLEVLEA